jgi:hypothetical protein
MNRLSRRVRQLERQSGVGGKYVSIPLPGQPGQTMRLPRTFAAFLAERLDQGRREEGKYWNATDQEWVDL